MQLSGAAPADGNVPHRRNPVSRCLHVPAEDVQHFSTGLCHISDIAERTNSVTFDYFAGQTTPTALQHWSTDWIVGGSLHCFVTDGGAVGNVSFANSAFFKVRLECYDMPYLKLFLDGLRRELCMDGQWLGDGPVEGESIMKFAPTARSFSGIAIAKAFENVGWEYERCPLWMYSYGAKLDLDEFASRALRASGAHVYDVGLPRTRLFEAQCVLDVGLDICTADPVVVCPDLADLRVAPFSECSVNITPMWGCLGAGLVASM